MQANLATQFKKVVDHIPFLPSATVIMPYNPKMNSGDITSRNIAEVKKKVTRLILQQYNDDLGILVLQKLINMLKNLNQGTPYQSVALFVSPVFQKVVYLNYPVRMQVSLDESFSILQAVQSRERAVEYLMLDLASTPGLLYSGNVEAMTLIKKNGRDRLSEEFVKTDQELGFLMESYNVPVFVAGSTAAIAHFQANSTNARFVVSYIPVGETHTAEDLLLSMNQYFKNWDAVHAQFLKKRIAYSRAQNKIACGMHRVSEAVSAHRIDTLIIKQRFSENFPAVNMTWTSEESDQYLNRYSYLRNSLDGLIEKVLEGGGIVEMVPDDFEPASPVCVIFK